MTIDCAAVLASAYGVGLTEPPHFFLYPTLFIFCLRLCASIFLQLPAMDASARVTMKDAAKCDKHCELQNSVNQQNFERILRLRDIPEGMPASESPPYPARQAELGAGRRCALVLRKRWRIERNRISRCTPTTVLRSHAVLPAGARRVAFCLFQAVQRHRRTKT